LASISGSSRGVGCGVGCGASIGAGGVGCVVILAVHCKGGRKEEAKQHTIVQLRGACFEKVGS
jgi:hypothetical protein